MLWLQPMMRCLSSAWLIAGLVFASNHAKADAAKPALQAQSMLTKGPYVTEVGTDFAVVRFELAVPGAADVEIEAEDAGVRAPKNATVKSQQRRSGPTSERLVGLEAGRTYRYVVRTQTSSQQGSFTTAPATNAPFRFIAYGDNRTDDAAHTAVAGALRTSPGSFLLNTGDLVEEGSRPEDWRRFFEIEKEALRERPIFSTVGNHELLSSGGIEYAQYFGIEAKDPKGLPFFNFTRRWGGVRFFFLNSMTAWVDSADRKWLEDELAKADAEKDLDLRITVMHHGLYSSGPHGPNKRMIEAGLPQLFKRHHIDVMFSGHDHIYERGIEDGLRYVLTGGGGAPLYSVKNRRSGMRKAEPVRHFVEASVAGKTMTFTARRVDGSEIETCGFSSEKPDWACDAVTDVATPTPPSATKADAKTNCGCANAAFGAGRASSEVALGVCVVVCLVRRKRSQKVARFRQA